MSPVLIRYVRLACVLSLAFAGPLPADTAELFLQQTPTGFSCQAAESGVQAIAENFVLDVGQTIDHIRLWGYYWTGNMTSSSDGFTLILHQDDSGLPGAIVSQQKVLPWSRSLTGAILGDLDEWIFELYPQVPVTLPAGTYYAEIWNTSFGTPDSFCWSGGSTDPVHGLPEAAFAPQTPGADWDFATTDSAIELWHVGPIFFDGFESGDTLAWQ